ncbi:MAG: beta strand repeat-containing protein, partial [Bacteroidales bacterium]
MKNLFTNLKLKEIIQLLFVVFFFFAFTIRVNGQSQPIFDANVDTLLSPNKNCGSLTPILHGNTVLVTNYHYPTPITDVGTCTAVTYKWEYSDFGTFGTWSNVNSYGLTNLNFPNVTYYNNSDTIRVFYLRRAVFSSCTVPSYSEAENWTTPRKFTIYPPFRASIAQTNVLCFNNTTGSATATLTGSAPGFVYTWGTSPVQTTTTNSRTNTATNLSAGTFTLHVSSATGCTIDTSIIITQPNQLTAAVGSSTAPSCVADNGTIDINVGGGVLPYTFAWTKNGSAYATTEDLTGLAVGTYVVTVTDANGCTTTTSKTFTAPPSITLAITNFDNVSCYNGTNGTINLTASNGTPGFTYAWTKDFMPYATTEDLIFLGAGVYAVTVTDANGCTASISKTITEPAILQIQNLAFNDLTCYQNQTGNINITVAGGTPSYTYAWTKNGSPYSTTEDLTGLTIGVYAVTVTDAKGCTVTANKTIIEPTILTAVITSFNNLSCFGSNNGAINLTVGGGTPAYTYAWTKNSSAFATTEDLTAIGAGNYAVTVTDNKGCTVTATQSITQPGQLVVNLGSTTNVSCYNGSNGAINVIASSGTPGYTYAWTKDFFPYAPTTANISGLTIGRYEVTVTDANGCTATTLYNVTEPAILQIQNLAYNDLTCYQNQTGNINITVTGGTTAYTYAWTKNSIAYATTEDLTGLTIGAYAVTVTDAKGCTVTANKTIVEPALLTSVITTFNNISCNGASNGAINLTVGGGTPAYTYAWTKNSSAYATTEDLSALQPGTYAVTVSDTKGCTATASQIITQPDLLVVTLGTTTNVSCYNGTNGAISINVNGGTASFTYAWTKDLFPYATTKDLTNLGVGSYIVTVTDANGCTATNTYNVTEPAILQIQNLAYNDLTCYQNQTGNINITVAGGTPAYTYAWTKNGSAYSTSEDLTGLTIGAYAVIVTDSKGCTVAANKTIVEPTLLTAVITTFNNINCNGASNGAINLTVGGGTPAYTYAWTKNSITYASTEDLSALQPGTYAVTVSDTKGCTATASQIITQPDLLVVTLGTTTNVSCYNGTNGAISINVVGGTASYTYAWTKDLFPYATTKDLTNLGVGSYIVTVTDANGCTATNTYNVTEPAILQIQNLAYNDLTCYQNQTGNINITVAGGTPAYTYAWTKNAIAFATTEDLTGLTIGAYAVTVTDAKGCTVTANKTIIEPALLTAVITTFNNINCNGASNGAINLTVGGGTPAYTYAWTKNSITYASTEDLSTLQPGTYAVTVTDAKGCSASTSQIITQPDLLVVTLGTTTNVSCYNGTNGAINIDVVGGTAPYTYAWTKDLFPYATTEDLTNLGVGSYIVTVTDAHGCTATTTYNVTEPAILQIQNLAYNDLTCYQNQTGNINITVAGGTPAYTYAWTKNGSAYSTSEDLTGLTIGAYAVTVTDSKGCTVTANKTIIEPALLTAVITTFNNISCNGVNDGAINLTVAGGTPV